MYHTAPLYGALRDTSGRSGSMAFPHSFHYRPIKSADKTAIPQHDKQREPPAKSQFPL
ncbi:MAG: hypothetical protein LKH27_12195 [Prevotella sp.]|nr:hypothetical protein [Prevotella sp.]MCH4250626.1 hypothetical protein [Prevotella sp.]MCI1475149.1 hypothetical protein [Prevotella sp.]MCI1550120.1 hypothetical protein [Prevotella sp.]MCI1596690.1 hypothetical protein [Prevotella sp.]